MGPSFLSIINLTIICGISLMIQVVYWYGVFNRLKRKSGRTIDTSNPPEVCILICVKNGENDLKELIPVIAKQDYSSFNILVANDHSTDDTEKALISLQSEFKNLTYFNVKQEAPGKKQAIIEALPKIDSEWILFTDVDCRPVSDQWIKDMILEAHQDHKSICLAYSPYLHDQSLLSRWVAFENWLIGVLYLSFAKIGKPYMGVGRNMAVRKSVYLKEHLQSHLHLNSGDDDLTLQAILSNDNYTIQLKNTSFTYTTPPLNLRDYVHQKRRHYTTASEYATELKIALSIFPVSQISFYLSAVFLLFKFPMVGAYFLIIRWLLIYPIQKRLQGILELKLGFIWFIVFDIILVAFYTIFSLSFILPKPKKWA
ncbi:MAG: glycosyltransferase [Saprospiraceae bacterium]|nr:glycosyltransferase [Saprospiraceae bacterium]